MRGCSSMIISGSTPTAIKHGLEELTKATTNPTDFSRHDDEEPIFLLATGWRTGSTLMQRILATDSSLLMWGEPHGRMGILSRMGDMLASFDRSIAPESVVLKSRPGAISGEWIANLYPRTSVIRQALQSMIYEWLGQPDKGLGYTRWGMKEVRLGYDEAALLLLAFSQGKICCHHPQPP